VRSVLYFIEVRYILFITVILKKVIVDLKSLAL